MQRRSFLSVCATGLATAGCLAPRADTGGSRPETSSTERSPTPTDSERGATPHEFVHVERVPNESSVPDDETVAFRDLSAERRRTFRAALDRERVAAEGWSTYNESRPTYVRYDGAYFRVIVAVH